MIIYQWMEWGTRFSDKTIYKWFWAWSYHGFTMDLPCFCAGRYLEFYTFFTTQGTHQPGPSLHQVSAIVATRFLDVLLLKLG